MICRQMWWISEVHPINCFCVQTLTEMLCLRGVFWPILVRASFCLSLPLCFAACLSLMRLIAPERCVMSAQTFLLALLMWQFEGCDCVVSQVTDGCRGGRYCLFTRVVNETKTQQNMPVCTVMQCLQCFVWKFIHRYIDPSANLFAVFCFFVCKYCFHTVVVADHTTAVIVAPYFAFKFLLL